MKKVKWGVIGCGGIADRRTIPGMLLADNAELVAVMDVNFEMAKKCRDKFHAAYAFDNTKDLLALPEIDAVYIATPVIYHKHQAVDAAKAKKHILLEKPLALTAEDSQEIADICAKNGVKLGVGLMMRYHALHQEIKKIISEGDIGQIVSMRAQFTCWYPEIENSWRQKKATSGGGALMDMGIHCIDLLQYMSGLNATDVTGFMGNQLFKYEVEDSASIIMKMSNGAFAYVDSNFNIPDDAAVCKLEIYGSAGSIIADGTIAQSEVGTVKIIQTNTKGYDAQQLRSVTNAKELKADISGNMYTKEIQAFSDAILKDKKPPVSAEDAINVQKIVEGAYLAGKTRTCISLRTKT
jgi:predicted dehydrogenase